MGVGERGPGEEGGVAFFYLVDGVGVVVAGEQGFNGRDGSGHGGASLRCYGDISTIEDGGPAVEGVGVEGDIVAATESNFT